MYVIYLANILNRADSETIELIHGYVERKQLSTAAWQNSEENAEAVIVVSM